MKPSSFTVRHFEARRFFVASSIGSGREHLVDLDENGGRGECSCEDHKFRAQAEYAAGNDADLPCKHIRAAREAEKALAAPAENQATPTP